MPIGLPHSNVFLPEWLFEQDYLVFLSFAGWVLVGLLSWIKPLSSEKRQVAPWLWFGYFSFALAVSEFIRILSFSDPFFRVFKVGTAFEMLAYGLLLDFALRFRPGAKFRSRPPYAGIGGLLLGFAMESGSFLYTEVTGFLVALFASVWACSRFAILAKRLCRPEYYAVVVGIGLLIPAWFFAPERWAYFRNEEFTSFLGFPFYGFTAMVFRIAAGWFIIGGLWRARLLDRIEDVVPQVKEQLRYLGFRVLPGTLLVVVLLSYLIALWNGRRIQDTMERDYAFRSQAAALAMDPGLPNRIELTRNGEASEVWERLQEQIAAIRAIGTDALNVYIWQGNHESVNALAADSDEKRRPVMSKVYPNLKDARGFENNESFLIGPVASGTQVALVVSSPVLDAQTGMPAYWIGIDLEASDWIRNITMARLQTIIIAGLVISLAVFFLYYQIEHESEADLLMAKERAEAADRAKNEFLAVISHEIRTPLQSVLGYSDLLKSTPLNEKQFACLDTIQSEGKILLRIVQDILDFSNLRKTNFELRDDEVHLRRLINETYRTISPMAGKKGLVPSLEVDEGFHDVVEADGVRLRQVLLNIFGNSVKYTEQGKVKLAVKWHGGSEDADEDGVRRVGLDFIISDTGIGIKEDDLKRLFEPFIQLEHTSHFGREGAGLGLAIVKRIIELMGGTISVESQVGVGSTFKASFRFPVIESTQENEADAEAQALDREASLALGKTYPMKVLVADDNPMIGRLVCQYLETLGYYPDLVNGGRPASEQGQAYDLVVIDLRMPGIDGPTAATMIRDKTSLDENPWIIGVSATLAESEIDRALSMGINEFLGKPFYAADLGKKIMNIPWIEDMKSIGDETEEEDVVATVEESSESPTGGGMGFFSPELVKVAVDEVYQIHKDMIEAEAMGDYAFIEDKAHYLANTAVAVGIDCLYTDSKALESAASKEQSVETAALLVRLRANFETWDKQVTLG